MYVMVSTLQLVLAHSWFKLIVLLITGLPRKQMVTLNTLFICATRPRSSQLMLLFTKCKYCNWGKFVNKPTGIELLMSSLSLKYKKTNWVKFEKSPVLRLVSKFVAKLRSFKLGKSAKRFEASSCVSLLLERSRFCRLFRPLNAV